MGTIWGNLLWPKLLLSAKNEIQIDHITFPNINIFSAKGETTLRTGPYARSSNINEMLTEIHFHIFCLYFPALP